MTDKETTDALQIQAAKRIEELQAENASLKQQVKDLTRELQQAYIALGATGVA